MASKFMAFESVASTSSASMNQSEAGERIEMNTNQYPNYQSNQMHGDASSTTESTNTYGVVGAVEGEEDDLNDNLEEKTEKDLGYRKFIYNNSEQFKSICGGLLLLMGSGVHIVWGIFRVFYLYKCREDNSFYLRLVIWSWYIGAIIGCSCAGYAVVKYRKGHIYSVGGGLLTISGILLMLSDNNTNFWLLLSRTIGGFTQGLAYVVVIVHASENATKEFRELLMMCVGAVINYSILVSVLSFFHTEGLFRTGLLNGAGLVAFGVLTIMITMKHATETVPFILQTNGSELDALQTVGKLKKRPVAARSVHHDFLLLKNQVQDEIDHYGVPNFRTVLLPENRKSLIFCCYGRLCSVLSFNLPLIVIIMLFLRSWVDSSSNEKPASKGQCDYLIAYNSGQMEEYFNRTHFNTETAPGSEKSTAEGNARPKRYTIEMPAFFHINGGLDDKYSIWVKNHSNIKKRDAKEKEMEGKIEEGVGKKSEGEKENAEKKEEIHKKHEEEKERKEEERKEKEEKERKEKEEHEKKERKEREEHEKKEREEKQRKEKEEHEKKEREEKERKEKEEREKKEREEKERKKKEEHEKKEREETERKEREEREKKEREEKERKAKEGKGKKSKEAKGKTSKEEKERAEKERLDKEERDRKEREERERHAMMATSSTFFAHLIAILRSRELTLILLAWFIFGTITALILYYFSLKRFIYRISCVLSSVLVFTGLLHSFGFGFISTIFHITLIVYFNYVTIPIDVFGHCMLAEAFPITLKAFSIASVAIVEHLVHILLITLYLTTWFHDSTILFMCVVAFVSHEIARNLPEKANLPLAEAHKQYQNIDLMLFNEPKSGYTQQQEFI